MIDNIPTYLLALFMLGATFGCTAITIWASFTVARAERDANAARQSAARAAADAAQCRINADQQARRNRP